VISEEKFSPDNFKKWLNSHGNENYSMSRIKFKNSLIGVCVESKINSKRLMCKMEAETENLSEMAEDFCENGGKIIEVDEKHFIIEVSKGQFSIHRCYVKKA
jgi:hypothetical protein